MIFDDTLVKIENLDYILSLFTPVAFHPDDPRYKQHWRDLRKRCIEGLWVEQFGRYRFTPGRLGFFGVFGRFEDWSEDKTRIWSRPKVRDLEWHRAYYRMEMDGFSGWSEDDTITSDFAIFDITKHSKMYLSENRYLNLFKKNGGYKEFVAPRENIFSLHDEPKGLPLYYNEASNMIELGSRGGGKSFSVALMQILPDICFDGKKYYSPGENIARTIAVIEATSGGGGKSTELLEKVVKGMDALADPDNKELGVWGKPGNIDYEPCPFFKRMLGSVKANNKENPWINEFPVKVGDKWETRGTGSRLYNTVYTPNQRTGAQKSAGGRRTYIVHEEIGLNEILLASWGSNEGMVKDGITKMAGQIGIGTSGNMETIIGAKKIFTHPDEFDCLSFRYKNRPDEQFGWFLSSWMVDTKFKDKDGNTYEEEAKAYHREGYDKAKASLPEVFREYRMNHPLEIEDMWVQNKGHILPVEEAEERIKELLKDNLYEKIGTPIKMFFDTRVDSGINYIPDTDAVPFYEWPLEPDRKDRSAVFTMFIHPDKLKVNGQIPNDALIVTLDPYVAEDIDAGGSVGVSHFIVNPKYNTFGLPGNCLAASLIGKGESTSEFHEILEMGLQLYGNPVRGLWYEADRGDKVRADFIKKRKAYLLCARPQFEQGQYMFTRNPTQTGYIVGGILQKKTLLTGLSDWLKEKTKLTINNVTEEKLNIERFPCIFTLRQIQQYDIDGNFDAVSSLQAVPLAIGEQNVRIAHKGNLDSNPFAKVNTKLKNKYARASI